MFKAYTKKKKLLVESNNYWECWTDDTQYIYDAKKGVLLFRNEPIRHYYNTVQLFGPLDGIITPESSIPMHILHRCCTPTECLRVVKLYRSELWVEAHYIPELLFEMLKGVCV